MGPRALFKRKISRLIALTYFLFVIGSLIFTFFDSLWFCLVNLLTWPLSIAHGVFMWGYIHGTNQELYYIISIFGVLLNSFIVLKITEYFIGKIDL